MVREHRERAAFEKMAEVFDRRINRQQFSIEGGVFSFRRLESPEKECNGPPATLAVLLRELST